MANGKYVSSDELGRPFPRGAHFIRPSPPEETEIITLGEMNVTPVIL